MADTSYGNDTVSYDINDPNRQKVKPVGPKVMAPGAAPAYPAPPTGVYTNAPATNDPIPTVQSVPGGAPPTTPGGATLESNATSTAAPPPAPSGNPQESVIDELYKRAGITDGGRGSGFADRAYWLEHPSEIANGRLAADLAGTGTDQPTGTPGSGIWQNSGRGQGPGPGGLTRTVSDNGPGGAMGGAGIGGFGSGQASSLYDLLMKRAGQSLDVNGNDPVIKSQTEAYNATQTRNSRQNLAAIAERAGSNANIDAESRHAGEQVGNATSGFEAQLMGNELTARRQEIQQALTGAQGLLTDEQRMQLQQEMASLDRAQRTFMFNESQRQNESQFGRTLGQNAYQFDATDMYRNSPLNG